MGVYLGSSSIILRLRCLLSCTPLLLSSWRSRHELFADGFSMVPHRASATPPARLSSARSSSSSSSSTSASSSLSHAEISRYSRHLVLGDVGVEGQLSLKASSVLVIGAGGLGSPCLMYLAAAGVGHIGIVDADTVDESNLQRQIIHATSTLDLSKCESAKRCLNDMNPHVKVTTFEEEFTKDSALRILSDTKNNNSNNNNNNNRWDVVVDGSDNFPTKYLINDACEMVGVPWVFSAILAFEGQLSTFNYPVGVGPTYRDMMPEPPPPGDVPSCAEGGVLGVLPGTMGCLQATEVLKILLHKKQQQQQQHHHDREKHNPGHNTKHDSNGILSGRVLKYDALRMVFSEHGLQKIENREVIAELIDYQGFCRGETPTPTDNNQATSDITTAPSPGAGGRTMDEVETATTADDSTSSSLAAYHSIDPQDCLRRLVDPKDSWAPYVLDVRLQTEHDIVALPFTDNVAPHRTVGPGNIPKEGDVLVYCKAGVRGKKACQRLIELGVDGDRLWNLNGGIMGWKKEVDDSMPRY